jgi:uncharacterized repeat protein (TIGR03803 family)
MSKLKSTRWKTACAVVVLCAATAIASRAQTLTTLYSFGGGDGANPYASLIQATDGNLYGTTINGGVNGGGAVFKITLSGTLTTLYSFPSGGLSSGPWAGLVQGADGNFYGTTVEHGTSESCFYGCGSVFKVTGRGALTTLYSFCSQSDCTDGESPYASLIQAIDGNFYGTTFYGGANGIGTLFKITPSGTLTTFHSFNGTDGAEPYAALVQGADGTFHGATASGSMGSGTAFKITPTGTLTTLYDFCSQFNCTDGQDPFAALIQGMDGNFYGITAGGGVPPGFGTVYRITPNGTLTTLYSFCSIFQGGICQDGEYPYGALIQATDGNFYGTTAYGGANGYGTVFKVTPSGTLTTLYSFDRGDGANPYAGLVQDTNGKLYGTTVGGGAYLFGTVFTLDVGLRRFVKTLPAGGKVGSPVRILGNNLTGTTSVTFNGTPATFTVVSSTLITATVPAGATTGKVQVTTPSGTLTSNVNFRVR